MSLTSDYDKFGSSLVVDSLKGSDTVGAKGVYPYRTIETALAAAASGDLVYVLPGTYTPAAGLTVPTGVIIRGVSARASLIKFLNVVADTTAVTMGVGCRIEDIGITVTSAGHYTLKGVVFPSTSTETGQLRTMLVTVDNSGASDGGTSNVYAIHSNGTGVPSTSSDCIRACSLVVNSAGLGNKRALLHDGTGNLRCRDNNFLVTKTGSGAGSYVAIECNNASATTTFRQALAVGVTADITQTSGTIEFGGLLLTNSASGNYFTSELPAPSRIFSDSGGITSGTRYLRAGTATSSAALVEYPVTKACVVKQLQILAAVGPGASRTDTYTVMKNGTATSVTTSLTGAAVTASDVTHSVSFAAGDKMAIRAVTAAGSTTSDLVTVVELY